MLKKAHVDHYDIEREKYYDDVRKELHMEVFKRTTLPQLRSQLALAVPGLSVSLTPTGSAAVPQPLLPASSYEHETFAPAEYRLNYDE